MTSHVPFIRRGSSICTCPQLINAREFSRESSRFGVSFYRFVDREPHVRPSTTPPAFIPLRASTSVSFSSFMNERQHHRQSCFPLNPQP
ncbi:hypothetical protein EUGRSUZ_G00008 [Eucalyptus grandis]|uniref:Uncharacterized protein n=2 Tax=Eucalyptus grandis TaxID=71139 RepID=A0ACC3K0K8_EUCGR|nr:hypothetical protein EUGRSUZ_G00008 [Eucalyptus grandis]